MGDQRGDDNRSASRRPWQFSLRALFVSIGAVALLAATFAPGPVRAIAEPMFLWVAAWLFTTAVMCGPFLVFVLLSKFLVWVGERWRKGH